jgi:hypothetical protein
VRRSGAGRAASDRAQASSTSAAVSKWVGHARCCGAMGASASPDSPTDGGLSGPVDMSPRVSRSPAAVGGERRLAVVDLGSNTFRLVVFEYRPGGPFRLVDEVREVVRLTEGTPPGDPISPEAIDRAARVARLFAGFCRGSGIDDVRAVATSAIRDSRTGRVRR